MNKKTVRSLVEIFGHAPEDVTSQARKYWELKACPFVGRACAKYDHTNTICYVPEAVYQRFEEIIGADIPSVKAAGKGVVSVFTYDLSKAVPHGRMRGLTRARTLRLRLEDFSARFISGPNLPDGSELDNKIREILGLGTGTANTQRKQK